MLKTILLFSILLCATAMPAMSALTDADLDKIRLIVKEEVKKEVMPLITDINTLKTEGAIRQTEIKNLKEAMDKGFENVQKDFENVQKDFENVQSRIDDIQKNFDRLHNIIIACIGIPLAIIAIGATVWGILAHRRSTKDRTLEKQLEVLAQEIETLKQQQIVNP